MLKQVAVRVLEGLLNAHYRRCCRGSRAQEALFLSRQSDEMSTDFRLLAQQLRQHEGWQVSVRTHAVGRGLGGALQLVGRMFGDARALARCKLCFVEGYNPALSLLNMKCEPGSHAGETGAVPANTAFPVEPLVVQVWHAGGLFKQFGYGALDTPEGRSSKDAALFHMHRNYSWIVCSGEGAREGFATAFSYPPERVVALGHPSFDELAQDDDAARRRAIAAYPQLEATQKPVVLFAPTLHRITGNRIFDDLARELAADPRSANYEFVWSYHPVSAQLGAAPRKAAPDAPSTRDLLRCASLVVTDYSSIVFDAALLDVPFAFYVPTLDEYRVSPGLAVDPAQCAPNLCLTTADSLLAFLGRVFLARDARACAQYPDDERDAFIGTTLSACEPGAAERIVDFALSRLQEV